jgi:hypothetical protein
MSIRSVSVLGTIGFCSLIIGGCAGEGMMTSSGAASAPSDSGAAVQTDSLQACLARIPASASAGVRQVAEESCRRDEALRVSIVGAATAKSQDRAASGTQGDTLEACLARIPKDASAGQRMLAEESCRRDQANRR